MEQGLLSQKRLLFIKQLYLRLLVLSYQEFASYQREINGSCEKFRWWMEYDNLCCRDNFLEHTVLLYFPSA